MPRRARGEFGLPVAHGRIAWQRASQTLLYYFGELSRSHTRDTAELARSTEGRSERSSWDMAWGWGRPHESTRASHEPRPERRRERSTGHPRAPSAKHAGFPIIAIARPGRFSGDSRLSRDSSRFPSGSAPDSDADRAGLATARLLGGRRHRLSLFTARGIAQPQDHGPAQPAEPRAGARDEPRAAAAARFL